MVPPIIKCFSDTDSRVRYYACEALYNVSKVAREDVLVFFNRIFDSLSKVCTVSSAHMTRSIAWALIVV